MQQPEHADPPGRGFPPPAAPAPAAARGAHHRRARSEVAFRLPDDLGLGGGGGPDGDAFDEIGSEDDLFSTFMDIEKISSSGPSNRDCDRAAETSSPPRQLSSAPGLQNLRGAATAVSDMEATVPSRVALSAASRLPNRHAMAGDRSFIYKGRCQSLAIPMALSAAAPGKGGVLDRPVEKTTPGRQSEFDVKKSRKMSPPYRVILHNDNYNRREYVVQVLMKVIPGMTVDNAVNIMQEAHVNGLSVVIVCSQSEAEEHCTSLRGNGLRSSIEPASGGC